MSTRGPLLTAQQGQEGAFPHWLQELGLGDFLNHFPFEKLTSWAWLVPQYRVVFPDEFFTSWRDYPYLLDNESKPGFELYFHLWDSEWYIDNIDEPLWFLHPFFRSDDDAGCLLRDTGKAGAETPIPMPLVHPNDRTIVPYADYFFHWQGYALIDVIRFADCISPILNTPDVEEQAAGIVQIAALVKQLDPRDVLTTPNRWGGLATPMTWLSHYRALRDAIWSFEHKHNRDPAPRRAGAKQLAAYLDVTAERLSGAIKNQLLVLAQDWHWANDRYCVWTLQAWPFLQTDIAMAMEWLFYLGDKPLDYYLDEWRYKHKGQAQWAELHKVLPYEDFADRQYFLELAPRYLKPYNEIAKESEKLEGDSLKKITDHLRTTNYPFESFLGAFRQLHEEMTYGGDKIGTMDFRNRRPVDYYSLLAIRAEGTLRFAIIGADESTAPIEPENQKLPEYIAYLAKKKGISDDAVQCLRQCLKKNTVRKGLTDLRGTPSDPIGEIIGIGSNLTPGDRYLIQAFLCSVLARNYFAHHYYLDSELLHSEKSKFMLSGILTTVLSLLRPADF